MNDAAFGALDKCTDIIAALDYGNAGDINLEECRTMFELAEQSRAELANVRKLLEAAEQLRTFNETGDNPSGHHCHCGLCRRGREMKLNAAIAACRAETGKNQNA